MHALRLRLIVAVHTGVDRVLASTDRGEVRLMLALTAAVVVRALSLLGSHMSGTYISVASTA